MNYYRDLPCANYHSINANLLDWITAQHIEFLEFWNPIDIRDMVKQCVPFRKWLQESDLRISSAALTYGTTTDCCGPHIDTPPARFKLSWPVKNTQNTWNRWFTTKDGLQNSFRYNHLGGKYFYDTRGLEEVMRREVVAPAVIDAGTIHDVWFESNTPVWPRIVLQCKLFKEPSAL